MDKTIIDYPGYPFGNKTEQPIHTQYVNKDGVVSNHEIETFYSPVELIRDYGDFVGFICDPGGPNMLETRVPMFALKELINKRESK